MSAKQLHVDAMDLYVSALSMRESDRASDGWKADMLRALDKELEAIATLRPNSADVVEPTMTILLRSAATIALECGQFEHARKVAVEGLWRTLGSAKSRGYYYELFSLLDKIEFDFHLSTIGVELDRTDIQMSLASGQLVAPGLVHHSEVSRRITQFESLMRRTYERKLGEPYKTSGMPDATTQRLSAVYMYADARANSFAVTLRVGKPTSDQQLPFSDSIVDEILNCMELVETDNTVELRRLIPSKAYYNHCISAIRQISPDGTRIGQVGFTYRAGGEDRRVSLQKSGADVHLDPILDTQEQGVTRTSIGERSIEGRLETGDLSGFIKVHAEGKKAEKIQVPEGLEELVRSQFGLQVKVIVNEWYETRESGRKKIMSLARVDSI